MKVLRNVPSTSLRGMFQASASSQCEESSQMDESTESMDFWTWG